MNDILDSIDLLQKCQGKILENFTLISKIFDRYSKSVSFLSRAVLIEGIALSFLAVVFIIHCLKGC